MAQNLFPHFMSHGSALARLSAESKGATIDKLLELTKELVEIRKEMLSQKPTSQHDQTVERNYLNAAHNILDKASELITPATKVEARDVALLRNFVVNFGKISLNEKQRSHKTNTKYHRKLHEFLAKAEPLFAESIEGALQNKNERVSWPPKSLTALMGAFARSYYKPTLLNDSWCHLLTESSYDLSDEMVIANIIYSMGTLKIKPDAEFLHKQMMVLNNLENPRFYTIANVLHGLAMLKANEVDLDQSPLAEPVIRKLLKASDTLFAKDSQALEKEDVTSKIIMHQCFMAQQMFRSYKRRNFEIERKYADSQIQDRFYEPLKNAVEKWKEQNPEEKIQVQVKQEKKLSITQTPIDFTIECFGSSKKTILWIQVDGKMQHHLFDRNSSSELRGQDILQQKVADKHLESGHIFKRVSYQDIYPSQTNNEPVAAEQIIDARISRIAEKLVAQAVESYKAQAEAARIKSQSHRRS